MYAIRSYYGEGKVDIKVFTGTQYGGCTETSGFQVFRNGGTEVTGVTENSNGTFYKRFTRVVAAQGATNTYLVPGVTDTQAVSAKYVNFVFLCDGADERSIFNTNFFSQDNDFGQVRILGNQFSCCSSNSCRRQIDNTCINRITSYNVCYTKLLRHVPGPKKGEPGQKRKLSHKPV